LDGARVFEVDDGAILSGRVGVYSWHNSAVRFDRVEVRPLSLDAMAVYRDRFAANDMSDVTLVEQGDIEAPHNWAVQDGALIQFSNIRNTPTAPDRLDRLGSLAVTGDGAWTDYVLQVRLSSGDDDSIGIVFRYTAGDNYYLFTMDRTLRFRRLIRRAGNNWNLLWEDNFRYTEDEVYEITIVVERDRLRGYFDGIAMFEVQDGTHANGSVGLYCWMNRNSRFHRVRVYSVDVLNTAWLLNDTFQRNSIAEWEAYDDGDQDAPSSWSIQGNALIQTSNIHGDSPEDAAHRPGTMIVRGEKDWADLRVVAQMSTTSAAGQDIGVVFRYQDQDNYYRFSMNPDARFRRLIKRENGITTTLSEDTGTGYARDRKYIVTVECLGNAIRIYLDGVQIFNVIDNTPAAGCIGFYASRNSGLRVDWVEAQEPSGKNFYSFDQSEPSFAAGTRLRVFSGSSDSAPAEVAGTIDRFRASTGESGQAVFEENLVAVRLLHADGTVAHEREFPADDAYFATNMRLLRNPDGTAFMLFPNNGPELAEGQYRLEFSYRRDVDDLPVLSMWGTTDDESGYIVIPWETTS
jgi:hypothetical protein